MFNLPTNSDVTYKVLCLGAHCDDIEIGCGGTLLRLTEEYEHVEVYWVVFSSNEQREQEALTSAHSFLNHVRLKHIVVNKFRDGFFPFVGDEIKEYFERLKSEFIPDLIFTHYRDDLHQDHVLISKLTWNTFRNNLILEYEIPKYDGDFGSPNVFVRLNEELCRRKTNIIMNSFASQKGKHWFTEDTFLALLRLRGMEANSFSRYAEAFYCRKMTF